MSNNQPRAACIILVAVYGSAFGPGLTSAAEILRIGDSAGGVSADGTVVAGSFYDADSDQLRAYRWEAGVMHNLGVVTGTPGSFGSEVSADGKVVVGQSGDSGFRWSAADGIGALGAASNVAWNTSGDGAVAVGLARNGVGVFRGFRHTAATGLTILGDLPGGFDFSVANSVSADGSTIVGSSSATDGDLAVRWIGADPTPQSIGLLRPTHEFSEAYDVTPDGQVIVGVSGKGGDFPENEAFRWTQAGGFQGLGDLPGGLLDSFAGGVNADGTVIVGTGNPGLDLPDVAIYWTQADGMRSLWDVATAAGIDLSAWETFVIATDVSADGKVIVGSGYLVGGEIAGFRMVVPEPTAGLATLGTLPALLRRRRR